jgi:hypothetical protein
MPLTVIAVLCHVLAGIADPVCREETVTRQSDAATSCPQLLSNQAALAQWKANSNFSGDDWRIAAIKCVPGEAI